MKIIQQERLIIGYIEERPLNYEEGWQFLDKKTGKKSLFFNGYWIPLDSKNNENVKIPNKLLSFKESTLVLGAGNCFHYSEILDKTFYVNSNITEITDITTNAKTDGVAWNSSWGLAKKMMALADESLIIFTDTTTLTTFGKKCTIYKFTDINDASPTLVYDSDHDSEWATSFGLGYHLNGIGSIILAGEYGNTTNSKDLLLSLDNGNTWIVKKSTGASTNENNIHWHDVEVDVHSGILWAGQGDGIGDKFIYWSQTMGDSWTIIIPDPQTGVGIQPTMIVSLPYRTLFGNDDSFAGFGSVDRPNDLNDYDALLNGKGLPTPFYTTRNRTIGGEPVYPRHKYKFGNNEAIISESGAGGQYPSRIYMTGDGGASLHTVSLNQWGVSGISSAMGLSDTYVFARRGSNAAILYAEKPKFI